MHRVVKEVNASVLGPDLRLLESNERGWQFSRLLFTEDTAVVADSELCRLVSECVRVSLAFRSLHG